VVRSRLQEQGQLRNSEAHYAGVVDCIKKVFQKEGFRGFYRGCATNLMRTTPSAVITFTSYEMIHKFFEGILLPDKKHSHAQTKSDDHAKPQQEIKGNVNSNNTVSGQSQTQPNKTPSIPLGNKEQLPAAHWLVLFLYNIPVGEILNRKWNGQVKREGNKKMQNSLAKILIYF